MPAKKYIVNLSKTEREKLNTLVKTGKVAAYKRQRAHILLKADIGPEGPGLKDSDIAAAIDVSHRTVRQRLVVQGLEKALEREVHQRSRAHRLDGEQQAHLVALACSEPPEGRNRWSLTLLANKMVALNHVESISPETIRQVLKKRPQSLATLKNGAFPLKKVLILFSLWKTSWNATSSLMIKLSPSFAWTKAANNLCEKREKSFPWYPGSPNVTTPNMNATAPAQPVHFF